jgi:AAA15 family ATPase/GTPase
VIKKLSVQNFKSIKNLQLDCKRVNLFIGEPNVGKSNILESLSLQALQHTLEMESLVRMNDLSNLFYENDPSNKIEVSTDGIKTEISYERGNILIELINSKNTNLQRKLHGSFTDYSFQRQGVPWDLGIHPYKFIALDNYPQLNYDFLNPPYGDNLFFLLQINKSLRNLVSEIIQDRGFKLTLRQKNFEIEISKEEDSILTSYPFSVISDTLQRIIFYIAAIETNKSESTIIFEEPESNVFPYYTKYLAEKIAMDDTKQYFSTTHNPYFLQSIIEKTPENDLSINIVQMDEYQTNVFPLPHKSVVKILDLSSDVFLNFNKLLEA